MVNELQLITMDVLLYLLQEQYLKYVKHMDIQSVIM